MKKVIFIFIAVILAMPNIGLATNPPADCDDNLITPVVSATENSDSVTLSWEEINHEDLNGYKVVISENDSTPVYPSNGYLKWITDTSVTSQVIDNSSSYHSGDFGGYLESGVEYYFSVTAVYGCGEKIAGNVIHMNYPGDSPAAYPGFDMPLDKTSYDINDTVYLTLNSYDSSQPYNVKLYGRMNVVGEDYEKFLIKSNITVTDSTVVEFTLEQFKTEHNDQYEYGLILCSSTNGCIMGSTNATSINIENYDYDEDDDDTSNVAPPTPVVSLTSSSDGVLVSWEKIDDNRFNGYKVVASKNNTKPAYPGDGYLKYITDDDTTSYLIDNSSTYRNGDFGSWFKPGEEYYFSITALYTTSKVAGNAIQATYNGNEGHALGHKEPLLEMERKAQLLLNKELGDILAELQELRSIVKEQQNEIKYLHSLIADVADVAQSVKDTINQFITYGVDDNTKNLGEGERAAVIHSYKAAFGKLPESEGEMTDAIKIANGRWPSQTNEASENRAKVEFKKIYLRNANMGQPNDNAAVTVMAYGLRQQAENRNLESEKQGIKTFQYIYGYLPNSTEDWNIMQSITYSGATR
jgi:hypothetical protein